MLEVHNLSKRLGGCLRLQDLSLTVRGGELLAVIGPNGAGKSTLLKTVSGELQADSGRVLIDGTPRQDWQRLSLAQHVAVMGQTPALAFDFTVRELVALGRAPHRKSPCARHDRTIVEDAIALAGLSAFAGRSVLSLSGGERQRVFFAKAVAQLMTAPDTLPGQQRLLLLDEPTSALDLAQQARLMGAARQIADAGGAVLAVLHDLNLAAAYADRIAVLVDGRLQALDVPGQVLTPNTLSAWYGCAVQVAASGPQGQLFISLAR
jgi:iron complex transport system ATP-binding protein